MTPGITRLLRSRWFVGCVHVGLWLLLYLAVTNLGGKALDFREVDASANPPQNPVPVAALDRLFAPDVWPQVAGRHERAQSLLHTLISSRRRPPPPTTRKIEVTYQGFYQTGDGPRHAIFKLGDVFIVAPVGAKIATSLFIAEATMQALTLTNSAAQTNIVPLNVKKEIVVPIQ